MAAALGAQHRQRGLGHVHDAEQVGVDLRPEVRQRDVLDCSEVGVARVVDHDVEAAERLGSRGHRRRGGIGVGDVERHREDLVAVAVSQVGQAGGPPGGCDQLVADGQGGLGDLATEAAAAAGEEEDL